MSKWFQIKNLGAATAEIRLRGIIGYSNKASEDWWGYSEGQAGTVKEFDEELRALGEISILNLFISSEGGIVADGLAIHNILKRHTARVIAHIDGYAFSIATVVAMAADEIRMPSNALLMIHNASTYGGGDYRDFEREAEGLKVHNQAIRRAYAVKSGRDESEFQPLMDATTYMDGATAKSFGLIDVITDEVALSNVVIHPRVRASADFAKIPQHHAAHFDISAPAKPTPHIPKNMKALFALASLVGLSLKGDETEDQLCDAITAHKPTPPKLELNVEDPETKAHFKKLVDEATAEMKTEITNLNALIKNGAAGAAGAGVPVSPSNKTDEKVITAEAFRALPHSERAAFRAAGGKIQG